MTQKLLAIKARFEKKSKNLRKKYFTKARKKKLVKWYESGGKTILFFGVIGILTVSLLAQFIKIKPAKVSNNSANSSKEVVNSTIPLLDTSYAGFKVEGEDMLGFESKVIESSDIKQEVEIFNDQVSMSIKSIKTGDSGNEVETGFDPVEKKEIEKGVDSRSYEIKGKSLELIREENRNTFVLAQKISEDGKEIYIDKYNLFGEEGVKYEYIDQIAINAKFDDLDDSDYQAMDTVISLLSRTKKVVPNEIFVNTPSEEMILESKKEHPKVQSAKSKLALHLLEGYSLKDNENINEFSIRSNDRKVNLYATLKDIQIPDKSNNLKQIPGTEIYRSSSLNWVRDGELVIPLYSQKGNYRTHNLYPKNTDHLILYTYTVSLDQSVDAIKKQIKELDIMAATIGDNSSESLDKCVLLRGNEIPFGSPFCGEGLEFTKVNQEFGDDHKALDIVPNSKYAEVDPLYEKFEDEYFYAPCSGKLSVSQDKETKANVIKITCENDAYSVEFWHDKESFWTYDGKIKAGEVIGIMGETGVTDGEHIHYIIKKNGNRIDPLELIVS